MGWMGARLYECSWENIYFMDFLAVTVHKDRTEHDIIKCLTDSLAGQSVPALCLCREVMVVVLFGLISAAEILYKDS